MISTIDLADSCWGGRTATAHRKYQWLKYVAEAKCSSIQAGGVKFEVILLYSRVDLCIIFKFKLSNAYS